MSGLPPKKPEPARGALAGIKADLERAKQLGQAYDPRGHGNAYTHNFLNQKPWHPLNFRNQIKKWEAEQRAVAEQKAHEQGQAEFEAEQEAMQLMSHVSQEEQQRWRDRQSISFMYTKPPGLEAALLREQAEASKKAADAAAAEASAAPSSTAAGPSSAGAMMPAQQAGASSDKPPALAPAAASQLRDYDRLHVDPFAVMLKARANLAANEKFIVKGAGQTPAHGGFTTEHDNQRLLEDEPQQGPVGPPTSVQGPGVPAAGHGVVADAEDLAMLAAMTPEERSAVLRKLRKMQKEAERKQQLEEAQAVLQAAGYDLSKLLVGGGGKTAKRKHKKKKSKESKHKKKHKQEKEVRKRHSSSSSSDSSSESM